MSLIFPSVSGLLLFLVQREHNGFVSVSLVVFCVYRNRKFLQQFCYFFFTLISLIILS